MSGFQMAIPASAGGVHGRSANPDEPAEAPPPHQPSDGADPSRGVKRKTPGDKVIAEAGTNGSSDGAAKLDRWSRAQGRVFLGMTEVEGEDKWSGPFVFACLADTQLGALDDNVKWDDEVDLCRKAVECLNALKPRFAIVCGDLVNHVPSMYPDTDPEIRTRQVDDFKAVFSGLDPSIPLLCVCGNHDVGNAPNAVTVERYVSEFGDDYFGFWVGGVRGLVINSNLYYDPSQGMELYKQQQSWLEREMASARAQGATHVLLFAHHPLFLVTDDEEEDSSVIGSLSFTTRRGEHVKIPNTYFHIQRERREPLLQLMHQHGCSHVFSGHWHKNNVARSERYGVENVVTSAVGMQLGDDQSGFRLVKVFQDAITHRYFSFQDMPSVVSLDEKDKDAW